MTKDEAMQMALDAIVNWDARGRLRVIEALRAALAQPDPEPVAWMYDFPDPDNPREDIVHNWTAYSLAEVELNYGFNIRPLYTAPPQHKEWVGLTDEERNDLWKEITYDPLKMTVYEYRIAVQKITEAKLKEKNT